MATATAPVPAKCILVLGPEIGKTTLVTGVFESLRASHPHGPISPSVASSLVREGSDRVGFEVVTFDGKHGPLASSIISDAESLSWPIAGEYKVDVQSFESLVLPELQWDISGNIPAQ